MQFSSKFIESLNQFIAENQLIRAGEKIIIALSGGIDSMVLLDSLYKIKNILKLSLSIAHINHQLRGNESDEDEEFVKEVAKKYSLDCYVERVNTSLVAESKKISIQEAARILRYDFFNKVRTSIGFTKIATAHNADDNTETILLNIFRGSGIQGLTGIPVIRNDIAAIRPLLFASRKDIEMYALENKIPYRVDSSNLKTDYLRNFIRRELIPLIKENINPNISTVFNRTSKLFNGLENFIELQIKTIRPELIIFSSNEEIIIDFNKLSSHPEFLQEYFLYKIAKEFTKHDLTFATAQAMLKVANSQSGTSCSIKLNAIFYKDRDRCILKYITPTKPFRSTIKPDRVYEFEHFIFESKYVEKAEFNSDSNIEYVDADIVGENMILRNWREGDWFFPLGSNIKKKLSDFFIDKKIPIFNKHQIPILESNGRIVWICGLQIDDRFKITENTKNIMKLTYQTRK